MGARGRRGLIIGLEDLAKGVVLATEMKRRAAADALERERFEYEKQLRDAQLAEEEAYHTGLLGVKKSEMSAKAREASEKQRAKLSESIQRGRVSKNLESGNLTRAARIAFNRGITLPEHMTKLFAPDEPAKLTGIAAEAAGVGMSPLDYRRKIAEAGRSAQPSAIDRYKETEALAAEIGGVPAIPYNMGKASRFVQGADNLPFPETPEQEEDDDEMTAQEIVQRGYEKELMEAKNEVVELIRLAGVPNGRLNAEGQRVVKLLATADGQLARDQIRRDFLGVNPKKPGRFNQGKVLKLLEGY